MTDILPVRTTPEEKLPWTRASIYKFHTQGRYPEVIVKLGGKLFLDMTAFRNLLDKEREKQIRRSKAARKGIACE